jgi:16S rRNA (guanine527-N7)-methyltransferase
VAKLSKLAGYALAFLKPGGIFLAMKGPDVDDEVKEALPVIKKNGGMVKNIEYVDISSDIRHSVVVIKKV